MTKEETIKSKPIVIGIAGGSGSGKTTIAESVVDIVGAEHVALIPHDAYYRDLTHLTFAQRCAVNYDHPDSLETELLVEHEDDPDDLLRHSNPPSPILWVRIIFHSSIMLAL